MAQLPFCCMHVCPVHYCFIILNGLIVLFKYCSLNVLKDQLYLSHVKISALEIILIERGDWNLYVSQIS